MTLRWKAQKGLCCYCEQPMAHPLELKVTERGTSNHIATREHLLTRANNGLSSLDNVALAHAMPCNKKREDLPWNIWKSVCLGEQTSQEAIIACEEMGINVRRFKGSVRKQELA